MKKITFDEKINYAKPNQKPFIINNQIKSNNGETIVIKYDILLSKITFPDFFDLYQETQNIQMVLI